MALCVTCDVYQQLVLCELLYVQLWHEVAQALLGKGSQVGGDDHDSTRHAFRLHALSNNLCVRTCVSSVCVCVCVCVCGVYMCQWRICA